MPVLVIYCSFRGEISDSEICSESAKQSRFSLSERQKIK
jgi:hypothetical protein